MAPYKQNYKSQSGDSSSQTTAGPSRPRPKPLEQRDASGLPGLSKLKGSIRQTKRLLAKDTLEPGLKIATQRRLASLQADLVKAEQREVEKKNGGKYHMVKFFERQKVLRLIKRYKRQLSDETLKSKKKRALEEELEEARVMLNYVLHYPYDQKYISLFPPHSADHEPSESQLVLPRLLPPGDTDPEYEGMEKGNRKRLEILIKTREMMRSGELRTTPEVDMDESTGQDRKRKAERVVIHPSGEARPHKSAADGARKKRRKDAGEQSDKKSGKNESGARPDEGKAEDDFFESD